MNPGTLLVIEDEAVLGSELQRHFVSLGWEVELAPTLAAARRILDAGTLDPVVVLSDMSLPDGDALDLLEEMGGSSRRNEWVFLTGYGSVPESVRAVRLGAYDFLEKPCPMDRLDLIIAGASRSARAHRRILRQAEKQNRIYSPEAFLGSSRASQDLRGLLRRLVRVPLSAVVIEGETGVGKGLVARILHYSGVRGLAPLVEINCAALPSELLESELFGHEAGAFTGAKGRHRGLFEQANGGTLFLDEIGQLSPGLQSKLLKGVEDRRIRRLGAERETPVDVQLFAASNTSLEDMVAAGEFREDLFHRLSVFRVEVPPLRTRTEDIEELVITAIAEFNARSNKNVRVVPDGVWERLRGYSWPGNVRELRNVIERSVMLAESEVLPERWLGLPRPGSAGGSDPDDGAVVRVPIDGRLSLDEMEAVLIRAALELNNFNVAATARALGTTRQTLRYRIEKHGIQIDESVEEDPPP